MLAQEVGKNKINEINKMNFLVGAKTHPDPSTIISNLFVARFVEFLNLNSK